MSIEMVDRRPVDARLHDGGSAAVFIENVGFNAGKQQGDRRMFGFVEWWSDAPPPKSGLLRYVGDAFFSDPRTALFVHEAVVEKIARDAEAGGR
ncbi:hypothetical protein [Rhizobium leucaenae]|uniref:hypothetical protein n=1 Tax=Rhizobium leucaenae TaxID=29450 RepID=UPI0016204DC0|nr:hypothetical protein [Rhizobium leucaenae]MBB6304029.1 hypothetical protein [Rhizobium leucaenae]